MIERETRFLCTLSAVKKYFDYYWITFQCGAHTKGAMLHKNPIKYMVKTLRKALVLDMLYAHYSADSVVPKNRISSTHLALLATLSEVMHKHRNIFNIFGALLAVNS